MSGEIHQETSRTHPGARKRRKVVVTGLGATTALGGDVTSTWDAMLRGENGIRRLDDDPAMRDMPRQIGGRVRVEPGPGLEPLQRVRLSRTAQLAVTAAGEAWQDAGLAGFAGDPERVAVVVAAAVADMTALIDGWEALKNRGWNRVPPLTAPLSMGNASAAAVSVLLDARAGANTTVSACSSGTQAVATAADLIRRGVVDVVAAGGAEAPLHPMVLGAFAAMQALSKRVDDPASASRPYDRDRDGMVLGEGAGVLIMESEEHARARGARCYAEVVGIGSSSDAYHLVQPEPSGKGTAKAILHSLADAGLAPADVAHVNGNGVATGAGDASEARGIRDVFEGTARPPAVSANKSMIGHTLGAAGAIESIATVLSLHHGTVPPTRNFTAAERGLFLHVVHDAPWQLGDGEAVAVKNSSGFGGHNVARASAARRSGPAPDPSAGSRARIAGGAAIPPAGAGGR
ncbi:beta-ketoacyl-[acyl-carrier-protein] synthase family protein [Streptomyces sp. MAR4 CNX-425]|uniref:beta-ketoacyl-[acyl-carrier-protein] synthase family protein n=1 Tax=Streptomyces sp. MAR4 CNX-425 TaxID=3406343 RepID=UPI003B509764